MSVQLPKSEGIGKLGTALVLSSGWMANPMHEGYRLTTNGWFKTGDDMNLSYLELVQTPLSVGLAIAGAKVFPLGFEWSGGLLVEGALFQGPRVAHGTPPGEGAVRVRYRENHHIDSGWP